MILNLHQTQHCYNVLTTIHTDTDAFRKRDKYSLIRCLACLCLCKADSSTQHFVFYCICAIMLKQQNALLPITSILISKRCEA